jgi:hypothetical protein
MSMNQFARDPDEANVDYAALGGTPGALVPTSALSGPNGPPLSATRAQRRTGGSTDFAKHGSGDGSASLTNQTRGGATRTDHTHTERHHGRQNPPAPH